MHSYIHCSQPNREQVMVARGVFIRTPSQHVIGATAVLKVTLLKSLRTRPGKVFKASASGAESAAQPVSITKTSRAP